MRLPVGGRLASGAGASVAAAIASACILTSAPARAWDPPPERYGISVQKNVPIVMRDGTVLRADVYTPADASSGRAVGGRFPVVVSETPYGKQYADGPAAGLTGFLPTLVRRGYIEVVVDVRGTGASEGVISVFGPDEAADSAEVIRWAAKLPHSDGNVGMHGVSYLAIDQFFAAAEVGRDSPLKAIVPTVPANDPFRDLISSGGLFNIESDATLSAIYTVLPLLNPVTGGAPPEATPGLVADHVGNLGAVSLSLLADFAAGGKRAYRSAWWQARAPNTVLRRIVDNGVAVYLVGGLFDVFQEGTPRNYSGLQNAWAGRPVDAPMSPDQPVSSRYQLLIGPWYHNTAATSFEQADVELRWFGRWLKGDDTGVDRTSTPIQLVDPQGRRYETSHYPYLGAVPTSWYLRQGGSLAQSPPNSPAGADPIVFTGASLPCDRATEQWALGSGDLVVSAFGLKDACAERDIAPQSAGPGQLAYETPAFSAPTVLAGPVGVTLYATATTTDAEWVAKLSDVAPDGSSTDISQGALLGSMRRLDAEQTWRAPDGHVLEPVHELTRESAQPVVPGDVTEYDIAIRPTLATLEPGHRLRLTLVTSQLPHLLAPPPAAAALAAGTYAVQRSARYASSLELPLAPAAAFGRAPRSTRTTHCTRRRRVRIHVGRVRRVVVLVNGEAVRVRGRRVRYAVVDLRRFRGRTVTVTVRDRTRRRPYQRTTRFTLCPASPA